MLEGILLNLQPGDFLTAEIRGCQIGLKRPWDGGFEDILVKSDSMEAFHLIHNDIPDVHDDQNLIM